jgi:hypothetical protein
MLLCWVMGIAQRIFMMSPQLAPTRNAGAFCFRRRPIDSVAIQAEAAGVSCWNETGPAAGSAGPLFAD